jgi:predicted RNase H-like HicB family nuclease/DNA-binding XRE family transcriptional regulator
MEYRAKITREGKYTLAEFPDCPGCQTFSEPKENIEDVAREALEGWLETHLQNGEVPPAPKARSGLPIRVNAMLAVKIALRRARAEKEMTQAQVAKLAGVTQQMIAKAEHPDHGVGLDVIERVAVALGCDLDIDLRPRLKSA